MTEHTPGPWTTAPHGLRADAPHTQIMASGTWIADAIDWPGNRTAEANARLIAAAPDLLAALVQLHAFEHGDCYPDCPYSQVIHKARGE